jgi:glycosyltransferase involved in cell wall biosynthesis/peptidoglycan/xylan/chitin deacetylase (PgdA/CDA1 family)
MPRRSTLRSAFKDRLPRLPLVNVFARRILRGGASIFMFHRVLPRANECFEPELVTSTEAFADTLDWLSENFLVLPLDTLARKRNGRRPEKKPFCAITFDDGWLDNFLYAFPLLQARGLPATVFLPMTFIGTNRRFWQEWVWLCTQRLRRVKDGQASIETVARHFPWFPISPDTLTPDRNLNRFLMTRPSQEAEEFAQLLSEVAGLSEAFSDRAFLNWDEVLKMRDSGIRFGSHTLNHVLLTQMEPSRALVEVQNSRRELQERLSSEVLGFSYPWGAASSQTREAVRQAGYSYAVTTNPGGLVNDTDDLWLLPRIAVSDSTVKSGTRFNSDRFFFYCAKSVLSAKTQRRISRDLVQQTGPIKITFVIDQISEWEGGTERQLRTLIQVLDRHYFDPELCFIFRVVGVPDETLPCQARWICPDPDRIPSFFQRVFRLARVLRETRPHVIQTFFIEGIFAGIVAGRLAGVPKIVGSKRNASYWKKHHLAFHTVARLAHLWQCNSRAMWEHVRHVESVAPNHIELLPNAVDLAHFTPATDSERFTIRRDMGLSDNGPIFVSVANLIALKDIRTLLDAAKHIRPHLPKAQILVVGDGPLRKELEQHSKTLGLDPMIRFVGQQSAVRPYLAAADFGVLTSKSEGSSNSVLEYMAMGLPSAISNIAPNRELVSGLLFAPGDAIDLAKKLILISQDTTLRNRLRSEYLSTASQYSLEKFALRAQSYYSRLAADVRQLR